MSYARLSPKPITFSGLPAGIYDRASLGEALLQTILSIIGDDPSREGLKETPQRVVKAYAEWFEGYHQDPVAILKTFEDGAEGCQNELVLVRDIEFYSHCEHHMAPFFGKAHVAYVPKGKVLGLSKLARLVDVFAKRLQVQERLTNQIADTLVSEVSPEGVGVVIEAQHFCMSSRGVRKQGSTTVTSALRGAFFDRPEARAELMSLIRL